MTDVEPNISAVVANRLRSKDFEREMPDDVVVAFDGLVREGDAAVEDIVKAITQAIHRACHDGEHRTPTLWAIGDLMTILGRIDSPTSRSHLVGFLSGSLPEDQPDWEYHHKVWETATYVPYYLSVHDGAIGALEECGEGDYPDLLPGLSSAMTQLSSHSGQWEVNSRNIPLRLYLLARRFGRRIPVSPEQAVKMVSDSWPDEEEFGIIEGVINDFYDEIPNWPRGQQCAFYWFYGSRVDVVRGRPAALPYFAASVLANPSADSAAWSKFPGVEPSKKTAVKLAGAHPLPRLILPPAGWFPDTSGRHQHRYWDGTRWTEHVADEGLVSIDHLPR